MDLSGVNIALSRIKQIESRVDFLDQKFNRMLEGSNNGIKSFDAVLDKKMDALNNTAKADDKPETAQNNEELSVKHLIEKYSRKNGLDADLVKAVIQTESNFDKKAVSKAGAQGLMQLMPSTAKTLGVNDPFNPEQNISGGTKYLKKLINKYDSVELGLAAYNAGPENVNKYGGVPPYDETQNYVKKIMELQQ